MIGIHQFSEVKEFRVVSLTVIDSQRATEVSAAETIILKIIASTASEDIPRESNTWLINIVFDCNISDLIQDCINQLNSVV